jgi:hypothetical protein
VWALVENQAQLEHGNMEMTKQLQFTAMILFLLALALSGCAHQSSAAYRHDSTAPGEPMLYERVQ